MNYLVGQGGSHEGIDANKLQLDVFAIEREPFSIAKFLDFDRVLLKWGMIALEAHCGQSARPHHFLHDRVFSRHISVTGEMVLNLLHP